MDAARTAFDSGMERNEKGSKSEVRGLLDDLDERQQWPAAEAEHGDTQVAAAGGGWCSNESRLQIAMWLNVGYTVAELSAFFMFGSLSMLTDAFHNGSDVIALLVALYCERMKRPSAVATTQQMTFGPRRYEAIGGRLLDPQTVTQCTVIPSS